jgi:hypothetical protein
LCGQKWKGAGKYDPDWLSDEKRAARAAAKKAEDAAKADKVVGGAATTLRAASEKGTQGGSAQAGSNRHGEGGRADEPLPRRATRAEREAAPVRRPGETEEEYFAKNGVTRKKRRVEKEASESRDDSGSASDEYRR